MGYTSNTEIVTGTLVGPMGQKGFTRVKIGDRTAILTIDVGIACEFPGIMLASKIKPGMEIRCAVEQRKGEYEGFVTRVDRIGLMPGNVNDGDLKVAIGAYDYRALMNLEKVTKSRIRPGSVITAVMPDKLDAGRTHEFAQVKTVDGVNRSRAKLSIFVLKSTFEDVFVPEDAMPGLEFTATVDQNDEGKYSVQVITGVVFVGKESEAPGAKKRSKPAVKASDKVKKPTSVKRNRKTKPKSTTTVVATAAPDDASTTTGMAAAFADAGVTKA